MALLKGTASDNAQSYLVTNLGATLDLIDVHRHNGSTTGLSALNLNTGTALSVAGDVRINGAALTYRDNAGSPANHTLGALDIAQTWTAVQTIQAPVITGITTLAIRDTTAAFDVTLAATSTSATITAGRTITIDVGNVAHTIALGTTANTITFPSAASGTVPFLNLAQAFSAVQTFSAASPITLSNATATIDASAATASMVLLSRRTAANAGTAFSIQTYSGTDTVVERITVNGGQNQGGGLVKICDPINVSSTVSTNNQLWTSSQGAGSSTMYIGNASVTVSSDIRLKADIQPNAINWTTVLNRVPVRSFIPNDPSDRNNPWGRQSRGRYTSPVAQELLAAAPELRYVINAPDVACPDCSTGKVCIAHSGYWGIDVWGFIGPLIAAVQELSARVATLEGRP